MLGVCVCVCVGAGEIERCVQDLRRTSVPEAVAGWGGSGRVPVGVLELTGDLGAVSTRYAFLGHQCGWEQQNPVRGPFPSRTFPWQRAGRRLHREGWLGSNAI